MLWEFVYLLLWMDVVGVRISIVVVVSKYIQIFLHSHSISHGFVCAWHHILQIQFIYLWLAVTESPREGVHHQDNLERFSVKREHNQHT
jgi:hypothetical protein